MAQRAKLDIRKIILLSSMFEIDVPIASQTKQILRDLTKVILEKELFALTGLDTGLSNREDGQDARTELRSVMDNENSHHDAAAVQWTVAPQAGPPDILFPLGGELSEPLPQGNSMMTPEGGYDMTSAFDLDMVSGINSLQTGK